ncbi:unnamed protein product [marine sediment metagenome]|uniref:Uncharacterized protein n=1 Tax=marine sediment metagenome TaxID=412755 RepID=X1L8Y2_9ZZZZ
MNIIAELALIAMIVILYLKIHFMERRLLKLLKKLGEVDTTLKRGFEKGARKG